MNNDGPNHVKFKDGQDIEYHYPLTKMGGMLFGDRTINIDGAMTYEDRGNKIKAIIIFQDKGKADRFTGRIYRYDPSSKK